MKLEEKHVQFVLSSDLNVPLRVKIAYLEGKLDLPSVEDDPELRQTDFFNSLCTDFHVSCSLYNEGKLLTVPVRTVFSSTGFNWNEWLTFPIRICELPATCQLVLTVWSVFGPRKRKVIGGTSLNLFGKNLTMRKTRQRLLLWPDREGDGSIYSTTPGKVASTSKAQLLDLYIKQYEKGKLHKVDWLDKLAADKIKNIFQTHSQNSDHLELFIELPAFDYKVVYHQKQQPLIEFQSPMNLSNKAIVGLHDPCLLVKEYDNPIDIKHLKLVSSNWRRSVHPEIRPSPAERDRIEKILNYPITRHLTVEDKDLLWKFRFYLTSNQRALTKFLRCVDWSNSQEAKQATELINQWQPIGISDALELLSKNFTSHTVRDYAVSRLEKASQEEILSYLLQLVQALRYDSVKHESKLSKFLIEQATKDTILRNYLYWYFKVECDDPKYGTFYQRKLSQFKNSLSKEEGGKLMLQTFIHQEEILSTLNNLYVQLRASKLNRKKKQENLPEMMSPNAAFSTLSQLPWGPMAIPVDPNVIVSGVLPDKTKIFSSSLEPLGVCWKTIDDKPYTVIFKSGDDLRQDQVIIQLVSLMDQLLKKENLDLKLTPYKVLSTSATVGMVEFVPQSYNLASVLEKYGPDNQIHNFFKEKHSDSSAPYGISADVINTFVRSCAGYCVITYLLCVGDRHLDNLLLTTEGHLFHIDFGFVGRDPKPYPPPMKLCTEMIAGMGGEESKEFNLFKQLCVEAYNILRKDANLILNLLSLMADSSIPDLASEKCLLQVQERFQLEKSDEEAGQSFQKLMQESVTALFARLSEKIHKWKQYWDNH